MYDHISLHQLHSTNSNIWRKQNVFILLSEFVVVCEVKILVLCTRACLLEGWYLWCHIPRYLNLHEQCCGNPISISGSMIWEYLTKYPQFFFFIIYCFSIFIIWHFSTGFLLLSTFVHVAVSLSSVVKNPGSRSLLWADVLSSFHWLQSSSHS